MDKISRLKYEMPKLINMANDHKNLEIICTPHSAFCSRPK